MGKKGGSKKGKPVVMTQQEFFKSQQAQPSEPNYSALFNNTNPSNTGSSWGSADLFGQNQGKVVVAVKEAVKERPSETRVIIPKVEEEKQSPEEVKEVKKEEKKVEVKREEKR